MKKMIMCLIALSAVLNCAASSVQWDVIGYYPSSDGYYYYSDILGGISPYGGFAVYFQKLVANGLGTTLSCDNDAGFFLGNNSSWWRVVDKGDVVDYNSMITPHDDYFSYYENGRPVGLYDIVLSRWDTVVLAFAAGVDGYPYMLWDGAPYFYGWVEIGYDGKDIFIVNSAMETTRLGIYAGTGNVVPEPSTVLLTIMGLAAFGFRRRKAT